jgi:hypothetical protein
MNHTILYFKLQQIADYIRRYCAILYIEQRSKVREINKFQKLKKNRENKRKTAINSEIEGQIIVFDLF